MRSWRRPRPLSLGKLRSDSSSLSSGLVPIWHDRAYFLGPNNGVSESYFALSKALENYQDESAARLFRIIKSERKRKEDLIASDDGKSDEDESTGLSFVRRKNIVGRRKGVGRHRRKATHTRKSRKRRDSDET